MTANQSRQALAWTLDHRSVESWSIGSIRFVLPAKDHRIGVDWIEVQVDAVDQFLFAFDPVPRSMLRAILLNMVSTRLSREPCLGVEDELEPVRVKSEPALRLF
jgi:hypothetical protein